MEEKPPSTALRRLARIANKIADELEGSMEAPRRAEAIARASLPKLSGSGLTPLLISKSKAARLLDMDRTEFEKMRKGLRLKVVRLSARKLRLRYADIEALVERRTYAK